MYIRYNLYRTGSHSDEIFNSEMIEFIIENDDHLVRLDEIIIGILTKHIQNLDIIKRNGIAYVGRMEVVNLEITDKDNINLEKEAFEHYLHTLNIHIPVIWNKQYNYMSEQEKPVKT